MATRELEILLRVRDEASRQLAGFEKSVQSLQPAFKTMAVAGTAAFGAISGVAYQAIQAANEAQKVQAQLNAVLTSTKGIAGVTADAAIELASALQRETTFNDEAILSAENLLLTFTKIGKDVFPDAIRTVLDMSTALGQDLSSSAVQLGKALQDPILGVSTLRRVGVNFSEAQQEMIKGLVESGQLMKAQKFILEELATEFGGSAAAQAETFAGRMQQVNNQIDDIKEGIGMALLPALSDLLTAVTPVVQQFATWAEDNPETVKNIILVGGAISGVVAVVGTLGVLLPPVIAGVKALAAAFMFLATSPGLIALTAAAVALAAITKSILETQSVLEQAAAAAASTQDTINKVRLNMDKLKPETQQRLQSTLLPEAQAAADEAARFGRMSWGDALVEGFKNLGGGVRDTRITGQAGGWAGAPQYSFTFNGDVMDPDKLTKQVTDALNRESALRFNAGI